MPYSLLAGVPYCPPPMDQFCKVHAVFGNNSIEYLLQKEHPSATIANKTSNQANANRSSITG